MSATAANDSLADRVSEICANHVHLEGPLLPILHSVQEEFGHLPQEALPQIAEALNISRAEVHGVVSFYHDFRESPPGRHVLKMCRSEACQAVGADWSIAAAEAALGVAMGETSADGAVTLEPVYCLGLCACGPAALLNGEVRGRMTPDAVKSLAESLRE